MARRRGRGTDCGALAGAPPAAVGAAQNADAIPAGGNERNQATSVARAVWSADERTDSSTRGGQ